MSFLFTYILPSWRLCYSLEWRTPTGYFLTHPFQRLTFHWATKMLSRWKSTSCLSGAFSAFCGDCWSSLDRESLVPFYHMGCLVVPPKLCKLIIGFLSPIRHQKNMYLCLKSATAPRKRGTFGCGSIKVTVSTHPSVSMVWITLFV